MSNHDAYLAWRVARGRFELIEGILAWARSIEKPLSTEEIREFVTGLAVATKSEERVANEALRNGPATLMPSPELTEAAKRAVNR